MRGAEGEYTKKAANMTEVDKKSDPRQWDGEYMKDQYMPLVEQVRTDYVS